MRREGKGASELPLGTALQPGSQQPPLATRGLRIDRLRIDAFGQLSGTELDLAPGLNVLCGPNEAGKSTLLAFLRWMLFGFEKKAVGDRYVPLNGQPLSGELVLATAAGPIVLRRHGRKRLEGELTVRTPRGEPLPASRLEDALGALSRDLYFQVFAFGLEELATFDQLASQGTVSDALFAAGIQGAQRLPETLKRLRDGSEALYAPRAPTRPLNQLLGELETVQKELAALGDRPARYFELRARQEGLQASWGQVERDGVAARAALDRWTRLCGAREDLLRLAEVESELSALPPLQGFPEDGLARWEARLEAERRAQREQDSAQLELHTVEEALSRQGLAPPLAGMLEEARAALDGYRALGETGRRVPEAQREVAAGLSRAQTRAGSLGLAGTLASVDLSAAAAAQLLTVRDALIAIELRVSERAAVAREATAEWERRRDELLRQEEQLGALAGPEAGPLREAQAALVQHAPLRAEHRGVQDSLAERRARRESVEVEQPAPPRLAFPAWLAGLATGVLALLPVAAFLLQGLASLPYGVGVFVGLAAVLWAVQLRTSHGHRQDLASWRLRCELRRRELERLDTELAALGSREATLSAALEAALREGGLSSGASLAEVATRLQALADGLRRAEARESVAALLGSVAARVDAATLARTAAREALAQVEHERGLLAGQLEAWLKARGFPQGISADRAVELMREAASLQETLASLSAQRELLHTEWALWASAGAKVQALASLAQLPANTPEMAARALAEGLDAERLRRSTCAQLELQRGGLKLRCQQRARALEEARVGCASLLSGVGAADEEAFRRLAELAGRFRTARTARARLRSAVEARTALIPEAALEQIQGSGGWERALEEQARAQAAQEAAEAGRRAISEERGAVGKELEGLEVDDQARRLRAEEESLRLRISALADRYAAERVALGLVEAAKRRYEEQHQPRLLQLASSVFATLTSGRYVQVRAPESERGLVAISPDGVEWTADRLSRGTREQLYLAFRIAAVEDLGETRARLPVIVDDVLVNFDAGRAAAAAQALGELSDRHQVLTFTCHPHMAELFVARGGRVLALRGAAPVQRELIRVPA
ncbi:MAG: AAA family ATPase [Myxococcota bacterium]|nr:AAA family ATPase [Myxococcota bacterium]